MDLRLNDLENFLAVSDCRSLTEGARKLGITQPALSESLKRLEADLGCVLLYRAKERDLSFAQRARGARARGQARELLAGLLQPVARRGRRWGGACALAVTARWPAT